jgi:hypothetical protein
MQPAGHNRPNSTGSIVPALAQNARAGHPQFRNGKKYTEGQATRLIYVLPGKTVIIALTNQTVLAC